MFIYLSKKIAMPNNTKIKAIAWNKQDGYIAVGGENGLLKVLKLDSSTDPEANSSRGLAASSNLSMNQTLEGHTDNIKVLVWNESHKKLTTSDQNGVIIVWMLYKGTWHEEMINNRKKSTVVGMAWSGDGQKICIIYEDGAVIVGCVGGNRIWGKELKHVKLSGVQWSPDGKLLLFSLKNGEVHLYDNQGNFVMYIKIVCCDAKLDTNPIVGLDWYNGVDGYSFAFCPNLAILFDDGKGQLMRNESDTDPVVINTRMKVVHCSWNHNGSLLAISGKQLIDEKEVNLVQFYNPFGEHLRTLKVPGLSISCCVWEGGSLRVALAVDSFVYFANIRPDYKWCYIKKTVVFASCKPPKPGICLSFWDTTNNQYHTRWVSVLLAMAGYGDYCIVATRAETEGSLGKYNLQLFNTLGTAVDAKYLNIEPIGVAMNAYQVFAASKNNFLVWHYKTPKSLTAGSVRCKMFHIDDSPSGAVEIIQELDSSNAVPVSTHDTIDPICCLTATDRCLIIGRESGLIHYYTLPHIVLTNRYKNAVRPHKMTVNCNSTRLVAEAALKELDLTMAEVCFVRSNDYAKINFVKKLKDMKSEPIRRAKVAIYFKNFDEAEKIAMEADRSDIALDLRETLGDWFRVIQILKNGVPAPDHLLKTAYNCTADYFAHFNNWASAVEYYELAKNTPKVIECYCQLEDWKRLEAMIDSLPEKHPLLQPIGDFFAANAVHSEAVRAYGKLGKIKLAVQLCISHNRWDVAIELAKTHNMSEISDLLLKYTDHLVEQGQLWEAIQMNYQAKFYYIAGSQAFKVAKQDSMKKEKNLVRIYKHYLYAAKLVDLQKVKVEAGGDWQPADPTLYENAWRGAEAYHYYMMAQRYLYSGKLHDALCVSYKLQDYADCIPEKDIYYLLALTACLDRSFDVCSRALIRLKSLKNSSAEEQENCKKLAWDIFRQNEPANVKEKHVKCDSCDGLVPDWSTSCPHCGVHFPSCIASGRSIIGEQIWICKECRHAALKSKMHFQNNCPLCHSKI
nr:unnamed protein product [Callosobruchus analis]